MSGETVFIAGKRHLDKYQIAYIKWICLCTAAVFPYIHAEMKGYAKLAEMDLKVWLEIFFWCIGLVATTTIAFIDKSANGGDSDKSKSEIAL